MKCEQLCSMFKIESRVDFRFLWDYDCLRHTEREVISKKDVGYFWFSFRLNAYHKLLHTDVSLMCFMSS